MPSKKRRSIVVLVSLALMFTFAICAALNIQPIASSMIDLLQPFIKEEQETLGDEIADQGADLDETIEEGLEKPDTGTDLDDTISEDNPGAALDDQADEAEPNDPGAGGEPDNGDASEPEPEPDPEPVDDLFWWEHFTQGVALKAYQYNSVGDTARGTTNAQPYVFVKVSSCGMRVDIRSMPTSAFP